MPYINPASRKDLHRPPTPNAWDVIAFGMMSCLLFVIIVGSRQMNAPFSVGETLPISLSVSALPVYALRSVIRMFLALFVSLLVTFLLGTAAAKSKYAEKVIIPLIDILQSIPILGFLSISVPLFIGLFPHRLLGPECAAIFTIFTSQVWNMILSFYQSLRTVPPALREAAQSLHLSGWQTFWRLEVPFAMPSLLWNTMLSLSAGWFFVVASEAIDLGGQHILLPGIGSYIARAVDVANMHAIGIAVVAMLGVIVAYDQLIFRPMAVWAQKFNLDPHGQDVAQPSWVLKLFAKTQIMPQCMQYIKKVSNACINCWPKRHPLSARPNKKPIFSEQHKLWLWWTFVGSIFAASVLGFEHYIWPFVTTETLLHVILLGAWTALRIFLLIFICCLIWVPIGVKIGLHPTLATKLQPVIQFVAAFPANLLFPMFVLLIVHHQLNVDVWTAPLLVLGTQWYILFNVIAGTQALPKHLHHACRLFAVKDLLWWRKLILPGIFPHLLTGIISAAGGAWNASILAEAISWGKTTLYAHGLGAYITRCQSHGHFIDMTLGIIVMCCYVLLINRFVWQPLYHKAQQRFQCF